MTQCPEKIPHYTIRTTRVHGRTRGMLARCVEACTGHGAVPTTEWQACLGASAPLLSSVYQVPVQPRRDPRSTVSLLESTPPSAAWRACHAAAQPWKTAPRLWKSRYVPKKRFQKQFHPILQRAKRGRPAETGFGLCPSSPTDSSLATLETGRRRGSTVPWLLLQVLGISTGKPPPRAAGPVTGPKTEAEKSLLEGNGGETDPFRTFHKALKDEEEWYSDMKDDQLNRAPGSGHD